MNCSPRTAPGKRRGGRGEFFLTVQWFSMVGIENQQNYASMVFQIHPGCPRFLVCHPRIKKSFIFVIGEIYAFPSELYNRQQQVNNPTQTYSLSLMIICPADSSKNQLNLYSQVCVHIVCTASFIVCVCSSDAYAQKDNEHFLILG